MSRLKWVVASSIATVALISGVGVYSLRVGRASTADQQSCEPASALPSSLGSLSASSDCVTGFTVLHDGTAVGGTLHGNIAVATATGISTISSGGSGPVTSLVPVELLPDRTREVVTYAVDEGIGVFNPQGANNLNLGIDHPLVGAAGKPLDDASAYVADNRFIVMQPLRGRPHLNGLGQYALTKPDGRDEVTILDFGVGELCALYIPSPGDVPERDMCSDVSDQLSVTAPKPLATPEGATGSLPDTGSGCSVSTDAGADAAHTIDVVVGRGAIQPAAVQVDAGERYVVTLTASDRYLHSLLLTNGVGRAVRDANGAIVCLAAPNAAGSTSADFVAPNTGGVMYLMDPSQPKVRVKVVDRTSSSAATPAPTLAPDVAAMTPPAGARLAPVFPTATAEARTATPAPVAETPAP